MRWLGWPHEIRSWSEHTGAKASGKRYKSRFEALEQQLWEIEAELSVLGKSDASFRDELRSESEQRRSEIKAAKSDATAAQERLSQRVELLRGEVAALNDSVQQLVSVASTQSDGRSVASRTEKREPMIRLRND